MLSDLENLEKELWLRLRNSGALTWRTREGKDIPIKDMSDEHLVNAIHMIQRLQNRFEYKGADIGDGDNLW